jgi:hypothetical protein
MAYTIEQLLEMLGGVEYYTQKQVYFVYLNLRGEYELAQAYLEICFEQAELLQSNSSHQQTEDKMFIGVVKLEEIIIKLEDDLILESKPEPKTE